MATADKSEDLEPQYRCPLIHMTEKRLGRDQRTSGSNASVIKPGPFQLKSRAGKRHRPGGKGREMVAISHGMVAPGQTPTCLRNVLETTARKEENKSAVVQLEWRPSRLVGGPNWRIDE